MPKRIPIILTPSLVTQYNITVHDQVNHVMAEGLGFNWYACYQGTSKPGDIRDQIYPAPDDEVRWERIFKHADWLNINFLRFGQNGKLISDRQGNFMPGHSSFRQLQRVNQWAQPRGVHLVLDPFSIPKVFQYDPWEEAPFAWGVKGDYSLGVKDIDGFVNRFVVPYVKYVVDDMGCKSVVYFNHVNEPLYVGLTATPPGIDHMVRYVEVLKAIRQGLDEAGLSAIANLGPDTFTHMLWPIPYMQFHNMDPDPYIQAYSMHHYHSRFDWAPEVKHMRTDPMSFTMDEQLKVYSNHAHQHGKPYLVTEMGMFYYGANASDQSGEARHDTTLLELEFIIRALRLGADGVLRWAWLNSGDYDGLWQLIETTDGSDSPIEHPYYGYATLMRFISRQASILQTDVVCATGANTVHAVGVVNNDGSQTLFVLNDHYTECVKIQLQFAGWKRNTVRKVVTDSLRKYQECPEIQVSGADFVYEDILSPMSLTVYSNRTNAEISD